MVLNDSGDDRKRGSDNVRKNSGSGASDFSVLLISNAKKFDSA